MARMFVVMLLALVGCGQGAIEASGTESAAAGLSENACHYRCGRCPPNRFCTMECTQSGNCGSRCAAIAMCVEGYAWDEASCSCKPVAGEPCGTAVCGAGTFCCNASCGICAPVGGSCTQEFCPAPL